MDKEINKTITSSGLKGTKNDPYAVSRGMYILQCALAYFISILTSGAYLAKLTTTIGISDGMTAILSNISSLACTFQLLSIPLSHKRTFKGSVILTALIYQLLLSSLYIIPFLGFAPEVNAALFFVFMLFSHAFCQINEPLKFTWFMSLSAPEKKGSFQSAVQIFSHATGFIFSFAAGYLLDYFTETGKTEAMFLTFTVVIVVLSVMNFITLVVSKEKPRAPVPKSSLLGDIKSVLKQKGYLAYVLMFVLYTVGTNLTTGFLGTYQIKELGLSMIQVSVLGAINSVAAIIFLSLFGRLARKTGLAKIILFGFPIYALAHLFIMFATPSNGFVAVMLYNIVCTFGNAGIVVGIAPILFDTVSEEYRTAALSFKSVVAGVLSFVTTLVATPLLEYIQASGNKLLGINAYAQQLFGLFSCIILLLSMALFKLYVKKAGLQTRR